MVLYFFVFLFIDFNPRPPWGGRLQLELEPYEYKGISIHALRGEGDRYSVLSARAMFISIHALRGEGDYECDQTYILPSSFQSTPSVGRATISS